MCTVLISVEILAQVIDSSEDVLACPTHLIFNQQGSTTKKLASCTEFADLGLAAPIGTFVEIILVLDRQLD